MDAMSSLKKKSLAISSVISKGGTYTHMHVYIYISCNRFTHSMHPLPLYSFIHQPLLDAICISQMVDFFCTRFTSFPTLPHGMQQCSTSICSIVPHAVTFHMKLFDFAVFFFCFFFWGHTVIIACNHNQIRLAPMMIEQ